jgi:hypothetical protein
LLNACADTLALVEPFKVENLEAGGPEAAADQLARWLAEVRRSAVIEGRAPSLHRQGALASNVIGSDRGHDGLRKAEVVQGEVELHKPLSAAFTLVVKHNALFTALLPELQRRFPVYAVVRNPLAVLASWNSVDLPVNRGRIPAGERYAPQLAAQLDATPDRLQRQLRILDWFCAAYHRQVPPQRLIRYESLVGGLATPLRDMAAPGSWREATGVDTGQNRGYPPELLAGLAETLLASEGAYWRFYDRAEVEALLP